MYWKSLDPPGPACTSCMWRMVDTMAEKASAKVTFPDVTFLVWDFLPKKFAKSLHYLSKPPNWRIQNAGRTTLRGKYPAILHELEVNTVLCTMFMCIFVFDLRKPLVPIQFMSCLFFLHICFSRSTAQATALKEHLSIDMVMNLDVPRAVIIERLTDRWIHPASGRVYAYSYRPPKVLCDSTVGL